VISIEGDISDGRLVGQLVESGTPLTGLLDHGGTEAEGAGFYSAKALGETLGWTRSIVGPAGRTVAVFELPEGIDAASGLADVSGRLVATTVRGGSVTIVTDASTRALTVAYLAPQSGEPTAFAGLLDDPPATIQVSAVPVPTPDAAAQIVESTVRRTEQR
jgi:hypothetical protein